MAGLILEITGDVPMKNQTIEIGAYRFIIESSDKRRIKEVRVIINSPDANKVVD